MARVIAVVLGCALLIGACTHSPASNADGPRQATTAAGSMTPGSGTSATAHPLAVPGCGKYCQEAGDSQGGQDPGYPCPAAGCLPCPPQLCVTLKSNESVAANSVTSVRLTCNLPTACHGAILLCLSEVTCSGQPTFNGLGGRLAAADFVLAAHSTSDVPVGLTVLGKQVASVPGYDDVKVLVDLLGHGVVFYASSPTGKYILTSTDPPLLPAGMATHCGAILFAGANTSCSFAENVMRAYLKVYGHNYGDILVTASSPVTGRVYSMQCASQSPVECTGGNNAHVAFYV
jgi:hypothetical protein